MGSESSLYVSNRIMSLYEFVCYIVIYVGHIGRGIIKKSRKFLLATIRLATIILDKRDDELGTNKSKKMKDKMKKND